MNVMLKYLQNTSTRCIVTLYDSLNILVTTRKQPTVFTECKTVKVLI